MYHFSYNSLGFFSFKVNKDILEFCEVHSNSGFNEGWTLLTEAIVLPFVLVTKREIPTDCDHLSNSSCPHGYWMTPFMYSVAFETE